MERGDCIGEVTGRKFVKTGVVGSPGADRVATLTLCGQWTVYGLQP